MVKDLESQVDIINGRVNINPKTISRTSTSLLLTFIMLTCLVIGVLTLFSTSLDTKPTNPTNPRSLLWRAVHGRGRQKDPATTPFIEISASIEDCVKAANFDTYILDRSEEKKEAFNPHGTYRPHWHASPAKKAIWEKHKGKLTQDGHGKRIINAKFFRATQNLDLFKLHKDSLIVNPYRMSGQSSLSHVTIHHGKTMGKVGYPKGKDIEISWNAIFGDADLFFGYNADLLTQDEWFTLEHMVLGGFRELMLENMLPKCAENYFGQQSVKGVNLNPDGQKCCSDKSTVSQPCKPSLAKCVEDHLVTSCDHVLPNGGSVVISGVPQSVKVAIDISGLDLFGEVIPFKWKALAQKYGGDQANQMIWTSKFDIDNVKDITKPVNIIGEPVDIIDAFKVIENPYDPKENALHNVFSMAAPDVSPASGRPIDEYSGDILMNLFNTALGAFQMIHSDDTRGRNVGIVTGNWGAGAYKNNKWITAMLQIIAAKSAAYMNGKSNTGIKRVDYYDGDDPQKIPLMDRQSLLKLFKKLDEEVFGEKQHIPYSEFVNKIKKIASIFKPALTKSYPNAKPTHFVKWGDVLIGEEPKEEPKKKEEVVKTGTSSR